jgi:hypothetical protein
MRLFGKLFGTRRPPAPCAIHTDDRDLVRPEDMEWWNSLSVKECRGFDRDDNATRLAAFRSLIERGGFPDAAAGEKVRLTFPTYYRNLEHRADEKFTLDAADAKLPYVLKDRVNRAVRKRVIDKQAIAGASSFNALVRKLIRDGRM